MFTFKGLVSAPRLLELITPVKVIPDLLESDVALDMWKRCFPSMRISRTLAIRLLTICLSASGGWLKNVLSSFSKAFTLFSRWRASFQLRHAEIVWYNIELI